MLSVFFESSSLTGSPDIATFDNSEIPLPQLTIGKKPETPEEKLLRKQLTDIPDDWVSTYRNSFTYWNNHKNIEGLPTALLALDKEWNDLNARKAYSTRDITDGGSALRSLAIYYIKISKTNPEEAKRLIQYINEKLKPLKEEFHPELPYKENSPSNNLYNSRQSNLRSLFIGLKRIKRHYPELQELEEMGDLLVDERFPTIQK